VPKNDFRIQRTAAAQRKQLLRRCAKESLLGDGLSFVNQSKITDDDGLADAAAEMDVAM